VLTALAERGERATAQVVKKLLIDHPSFSQYKFLWSLSDKKRHGVALLVRKTLMEVQPPPEVSYTLNADSPAHVVEARVIKVSSVPPLNSFSENFC
jgi:exonuclease III